VSYESRQIVAETGDVVVVGSDGIGAVVAGDGAMFEDEELRKTLEELSGRDGATIIEEALKRALAFGNNAPLPDDVMLVAMTRT
jgi:serine phosphatase RsbU (regulator of sigma subunit)